jgi:hypothetical protein
MSRTYLILAIVAGALATISVSGAFGLTIIRNLVADAAQAARAERDYYWRGQIDQMKAAAERQIAENLRQTMAAQDEARDQVAQAEARAAELERDNAALPDGGDRGLGRDRVRLLNKR